MEESHQRLKFWEVIDNPVRATITVDLISIQREYKLRTFLAGASKNTMRFVSTIDEHGYQTVAVRKAFQFPHYYWTTSLIRSVDQM